MNKPNKWEDKQGGKSSYNLIDSFSFALQGIYLAWKKERNLRVHFLAAGYIAFFAYKYYNLSKAEGGILVLTIAAVIVCELFNTSIENVVDIASPEFSHLAKIAKDTAAAAVLIAAAASIVVGVVLLGDPIILKIILNDMFKYFYVWLPLIAASLLIIFFPHNHKDR